MVQLVHLTKPFNQPGMGLGEEEKPGSSWREDLSPEIPTPLMGSCCWHLLSMAVEHTLDSEDKHGVVKDLIVFPQLSEEC